MKFIIVESPTKAKTIEKFLGEEFVVKSSYGHIRDLPQKEFGVDVENDFKPKYVIPQKAKKRIVELKKYLKETDSAILATDEDREGESIAWHLKEVLKLKEGKYSRIVFHEITKSAIEQALKNPRDIDLNLVNAQQARRILDRIVGYKLSPFLWKKVARGLSAGRVQSVAVRLVAEREREIQSFKPQEYWTIEALFSKAKQEEKGKTKEFSANLAKINGKPIEKLAIKNRAEAEKILSELKGAEYIVEEIKRKETAKNPLPPFITSTLQQEAWQRLRLSAKSTMRIAQNLYEKGLITYHRTDSFNLSSLSQQEARKFIEREFGKEYWPGYPRSFKTKSKSAQEAHEAIRPTYPSKKPDDIKIKEKLDASHYRVYDLIWRRFIASQMAQAVFDSTTVDIKAEKEGLKTGYAFRANGQILKFEGFLKVYPMKFEENELPLLNKGEKLSLKKLSPLQHFTQPPPRYTEASLIKALEKEGIGRPSTYAPILDTIQKRNSVAKDGKRRFYPTEIGFLVNDILVKYFPQIVDIKFTARLEEKLDKIAQGKEDWIEVLKKFYRAFKENLDKRYKEISKKDLIEETEEKCPECSAPLVIRWGKFGKFYACSNFPKCKYTKPLKENRLEIKCPKCKGGEIQEKRTKKGKLFYGCGNYPECDFALWDKPTGEKCPQCDSLLVEKNKKIKCSNKECGFEK
jgi:DNA topoisomerase-1